MFMGVTVFGSWVAFIPWKDNATMPWVFGFIACVFSYAAAYVLRYRVIVTADYLTVGAFSNMRAYAPTTSRNQRIKATTPIDQKTKLTTLAAA
jgi:hypothetical protein